MNSKRMSQQHANWWMITLACIAIVTLSFATILQTHSESTDNRWARTTTQHQTQSRQFNRVCFANCRNAALATMHNDTYSNRIPYSGACHCCITHPLSCSSSSSSYTKTQQATLNKQRTSTLAAASADRLRLAAPSNSLARAPQQLHTWTHKPNRQINHNHVNA